MHFSLRVRGKGAPSIFPKRAPIQGDTPPPEPLVSLFMYVSQSPQKEPSYKMGKNTDSPSKEPHADGRHTYKGVWPGSPKGSLTTLLTLLQ
jgi:hypothetical protein